MSKPNTWGGLLALVGIPIVAVTLSIIGLVALGAPHTVTQYYIGHPTSNNNQRGVCVMGSVDWEVDDTVFCTDDVNKAVEEVKKLNDSLPRK